MEFAKKWFGLFHSPSAARWRKVASLAVSLALAVTLWEYLLNTIFNPGVDWNPIGIAAHLALDLLMLLPFAALALWSGLRLARRLRLDLDEATGRLGAIGWVAVVFFVLALPLSSTRDLAHEWLGQTYGLSLAEVQTTVVRSDLTVREPTQLCSFGAVRNPGLARGSFTALDVVALRLETGARDALVQLAAFLPLLFLGLGGARRIVSAPLAAALRQTRWLLRPSRVAALGLGMFALFCVGYGFDDPAGIGVAQAQPGSRPYNACTDGGPVKEYNVHAIPVTITLNRWGDHVERAYMYSLEAQIPEIRDFEDAIERDRGLSEVVGDPDAVARVSHGLRQDPIQPLVIRANLGDCLRVHFTNALEDGQPASMHILGLPHSVENAASAVGYNPDTFAASGQTITYEIPIPDDVGAERAYYFHDHGAGRRRQNMGLFGAIIAEPKGATYLDVESGEPLDTVTGSNWEAIILDPNADDRPDGKSFREFVVFYHEIGDEGFTDLRDQQKKKLPLVDEIGGVYRPGARALNYRSEPFRRRLEIEKTGKSLGYSSYPFGDPATPIPRSYVGEATKTRLMHGGSEVFHVHHLHGGGDRWRRNPNADPNNDFWKGLTKVPDPNLTSIHLDSQSIGPGSSYNLEHECGAGGCQQGVGDFLFHCHIGHHYLSGMWSFWRVFGTAQTAESNLYKRPLAVVPELFQAENPFPMAASNTPPSGAISAGDLLGLVVDDQRRIVDDAEVVDPATQIGVRAWIRQQLPPAGAPLDKFDATVWDWIFDDAAQTLRVLGPPESSEAFAGYVSATPGERPEVRFNPKNGRYTWPLFRPQKGQRPPFTSRHSGAPWLGEEMRDGRVDGLCAVEGVAGVDLGGTAVKRYYPVSSIALPIQVTRDRADPDGQIFVLNELEEAVRSGEKPTEPLVVRSNVGDCVEIILTNKIPDGPLNKDFSKTNIHSHFVQFDTQASDGVITGFSYEQSVRPIASEERWLTAPAGAGETVLAVNHTERLRPGVWLGIGLGEGTCGATAQGEPKPCTEVRQIVDLDEDNIILDRPLDHGHSAQEAVGVEFVRYNWYSDVDFGTVFFHTHVEFKDWDHGLFGTHIVEPKGSSYHDPQTGEALRAGALADIHVDPAAGGNPVAFGVDGSFREIVLFLHNNNPVEGQFRNGGGTFNLRAEPWRLRLGEASYRFSSVTHGDPQTPQVRAYVGDPLVIRGMGLVERVGGVRFTGHRFNMERYTDKSDLRDTTFIGISERFDVSLEGGAGGPAGQAGDYLYYSTLGKDFEAGAWGILRVHDTTQGDLRPLPDRETPPSGDGFPQLSFTGGVPPSLSSGPGDVCPAGAPLREYSIVVSDAAIYFNELTAPESTGVVYRPKGRPSGQARVPLVLRANAGDCLELNLRNVRDEASSISVGELLFDPQRSYGAAIGYNYDSTVAAGGGKKYRYYADKELGIVTAINLGDIDSVERGAFAAVVIEPEGAQYFRPGRSEPLPQGGIGIQADILHEGLRSREMVALFSDQDRRIGQSAMPYPKDIEDWNGISYAHEPLFLRAQSSRPSEVFSSSRWGDPRHVVQVPAQTPLIYRVAQPWGHQAHVPTLEGHRYLLEPDLEGSEQLYNDVLVPGMSLNLYFVGGAGGDIAAPGDYLFLDRRQPFMEGGLWNILRVTEDGTSGADDQVRVLLAEALPGERSRLSVRGKNNLRPAGDFVDAVSVFAGDLASGRCAGQSLGTASVDPGSGDWRFVLPLDAVPGQVYPDQICVESLGGGVTTATVR